MRRVSKAGDAVAERKRPELRQAMREHLFTGLRMIGGISVPGFCRRFGTRPGALAILFGAFARSPPGPLLRQGAAPAPHHPPSLRRGAVRSRHAAHAHHAHGRDPLLALDASPAERSRRASKMLANIGPVNPQQPSHHDAVARGHLRRPSRRDDVGRAALR